MTHWKLRSRIHHVYRVSALCRRTTPCCEAPSPLCWFSVCWSAHVAVPVAEAVRRLRRSLFPEVTPSPRENTPSALDDPAGPGLPKPLVAASEIISGGPPPDGIPAIDTPRFQHSSQVDWLRPNEPVLAISVGNDVRAYPIQIVIWHEIVNDTVGGMPVAVTFCPLCDSAIAFDRRLAGRVLDFGTSGKLYLSDLVMYDRQTRSLWSQILGTAIAGVQTGRQLRSLPVAVVAWSDWRSAHPDGWVLSRDTGYFRDYGTNPYVGYDDVNSQPFLFRGEVNGRFPPKTRLVGFHHGDDAVAVLLDWLRSRHVTTITVAGQPVVVWEKNGTASALDTNAIAEGRDVGATAAFSPILDGRTLHFSWSSGSFTDAETQSSWDILGRAVSGPLMGHTLTPVTHVDTFWFSWAAFLPKTRVVGG